MRKRVGGRAPVTWRGFAGRGHPGMPVLTSPWTYHLHAHRQCPAHACLCDALFLMCVDEVGVLSMLQLIQVTTEYSIWISIFSAMFHHGCILKVFILYLYGSIQRGIYHFSLFHGAPFSSVQIDHRINLSWAEHANLLIFRPTFDKKVK